MAPREPWQYSTCVIWAWLSLAGAVYLTLLPFQFGDVTLQQAWETYRNMSLTGPGASGRAQFMANLFMFMPLGFFWAAWLSYGQRGLGVALRAFLAVATLGLLTTATVEFLQVWLPFRHPAGADIAGNFTGAVAGALAWFALREPLGRWVRALSRPGPQALQIALAIYAAAYVAAGLVPFDLVLSADELARRLQSASAWGLWTTPDACTAGLRCYAWLTLEVAAAIPVGLLLGYWLMGRGIAPLLAGIPLAIALGAALELLNLLTLSGITEGRSVLLRALGVTLGLILCRHGPARPEALLDALGRRALLIVALATPLYLLLLLGLNHGLGPYHADLARTWAQFGELRLIPFYYHYHVPEIVALRSTALHLAMYLPVGVLAWLWQLRHPLSQRQFYTLAVTAGVLTALAMETGKLFVENARPDPASLVLGGLAAWGAAATLAWLTATSGAIRQRPDEDGAPEPPAAPRFALTGESPWHQATAGLLLLFTLALAVSWPVAAWALTPALIGYAGLLLWRPQFGLLIIPALIPTLDLGLYTGRLYLSELDLFLAATLAVVLWRWPRRPGRSLLATAIRWPLYLLLASTLISLALTLVPPGRVDLGQLYHYGHQWNGLRVAKGLFGALLLLGLMRITPLPRREQLERWCLPGVALGLLGALLIILRERITYPGLLDLDSRYRITGFFTDMHVGGPSVETYLVLALGAALAWGARKRFGAVLTLLATLGTGYAIAVTYSRGGYLGLVVVLLLFLALALVAALRRRPPAGEGDHPAPAPGRGHLVAAALAPVLAVAAVAIPFADSFGERRLGQVGQDMEQRISHWQGGLALPGGTAFSPMVGRGLGSFPEAYRIGNPQGVLPANFGFTRNDGESLLRLGQGDSLFLNQRVSPPTGTPLQLRARVRSAAPAGLGIFLCEKPVRHSFECRNTTLQLPEGSGWVTLGWSTTTEGMADQAWPFQRGLVLSLSNRGRDGAIIDVAELSLTDPQGREYLRNGDFARMGQHWYMSTDNLDTWRLENQWLEVYFDQGALGVIAFVWLTLAGMVLLVRRGLRGDVTAMGLAAALAGALTVGLFSTIFFSERITLLFYLLLLLGVAGTARGSKLGPAGATAMHPPGDRERV